MNYKQSPSKKHQTKSQKIFEKKLNLYKHTYSAKIQGENISLLFYTDKNQLLCVCFNNKEGLTSLTPAISTYLQKSNIITKKSSAYKKSYKIQKKICTFFDVYFAPKKTPIQKNATTHPKSRHSCKSKNINQEVLSSMGTNFQVKVWNAMLDIPYGTTTTYLALAKRIKHPLAFRAVGTAVGKNPFPILIACHRVVPTLKNNKKPIKIGHFGGGSHIKKALLMHEKAL